MKPTNHEYINEIRKMLRRQSRRQQKQHIIMQSCKQAKAIQSFRQAMAEKGPRPSYFQAAIQLKAQ